MKLVEKGWGRELVWAGHEGPDGQGYTAKVLQFERAGNRFSLHFHLQKHETWLVVKGRFKLIWLETDGAVRHEATLCEGEVWVNPPGLPHQLVALEDGSEVIEVSTPDDPEDNRRIEAGDSQCA